MTPAQQDRLPRDWGRNVSIVPRALRALDWNWAQQGQRYLFSIAKVCCTSSTTWAVTLPGSSSSDAIRVEMDSPGMVWDIAGVRCSVEAIPWSDGSVASDPAVGLRNESPRMLKVFPRTDAYWSDGYELRPRQILFRPGRERPTIAHPHRSGTTTRTA